MIKSFTPEYNLKKYVKINNEHFTPYKLPYSYVYYDGLEGLIGCFCATGLCMRSPRSFKYDSNLHRYKIFDNSIETVAGLTLIEESSNRELIVDIYREKDKILLDTVYTGGKISEQSYYQNERCPLVESATESLEKLDAVEKVFDAFYGGLGKIVKDKLSYKKLYRG